MGTFTFGCRLGWDPFPGAIISDTFCVKSLLADKAEIKRGPLPSAGLLVSGAPWDLTQELAFRSCEKASRKHTEKLARVL